MARYFLSMVGNTPRIRFQYEQIKVLIYSIKKQYNVFCPLTKFECFLRGVEFKVKILSNMRGILVSPDPVVDMARE